MTKEWQTLKNETSMDGAQFRGENENLPSSSDDLPETSNLVISRCCCADDGEEISKNEKMHVQSVQCYCFCSLNSVLTRPRHCGIPARKIEMAH